MREVITTVVDIFKGMLDTFILKLFPTIVLPSAGFLLGFDNFLSIQALLVLIVIDFVTGISAAKVSREEIKSKKAVKSAFKVAIYGLLVSAAHLTETIAPGTTFMAETMITFLAVTELISVIENAGRLGFAVPQKLLNKLHELRGEEITTTETIKTHTVSDKVQEKVSVERLGTDLG